MDNYEYTELLKLLNKKLQNIKDILDPQSIEDRLKEIEELEAGENFWSDVARATELDRKSVV